jgi:hypothetical protein
VDTGIREFSKVLRTVLDAFGVLQTKWDAIESHPISVSKDALLFRD